MMTGDDRSLPRRRGGGLLTHAAECPCFLFAYRYRRRHANNLTTIQSSGKNKTEIGPHVSIKTDSFIFPFLPLVLKVYHSTSIMTLTNAEDDTANNNTSDHHDHDHDDDHDGRKHAYCRRLIAELSPEEQKVAAYASYRYFIQAELSVSLEPNNNNSSSSSSSKQDLFDRAVLQFVRHFVDDAENEYDDDDDDGNNHNHKTKKALMIVARLRNTLAWRQEMELQELYKVFDPRFEQSTNNTTNTTNITTEERQRRRERHEYLKQGLIDAMEGGRGYTAGYDKEGRAYILFQMHEYFQFDTRSDKKSNMHYRHSFWMVERALAATERKTNGQKSGMIFVFNYKDYTLRNTMPLGLVKNTVMMGLSHYPGKQLIHKIYLVDTPFLFRALWIFLQPFLDASTKSKIQFVKGDAAKEEHFWNSNSFSGGGAFDKNQCAPCMLPTTVVVQVLEGRQQQQQQEGQRPGPAAGAFQKKIYMEETPFDYAFGEKQI